jgi:hypothetical protein
MQKSAHFWTPKSGQISSKFGPPPGKVGPEKWVRKSRKICKKMVKKVPQKVPSGIPPGPRISSTNPRAKWPRDL